MTKKISKFKFLLLVVFFLPTVYLANAQTIELKPPSPKTVANNNFWVIKSKNDTAMVKVSSVDRFNDSLETSNISSPTLKAAPAFVVSGNPNVEINVSADPIALGTFNIENEGQDELEYNISASYTGRTTPTILYPSSNTDNINEKSETESASFNNWDNTSLKGGNIQQNFFNMPTNSIIYDDGDDSTDNFISPPYYLEWTAATAFVVPSTYTGKFILTNVSSYIKVSEASGETTQISVVKGGTTPSDGKLLLSQKVQNENGEGFVTVPLDTHLSFEASDKFWVMYSYAAVPIKLGYDEDSGIDRPGAYLLYANDKWDDFQKIFGGESVLSIRAIGATVEGLSFSSKSGTMPPGIPQDITVSYDASNTTQNGNYNFNVFIFGNSSTIPTKKIECSATVVGHPLPSIAVSSDTINTEIDVSENPVKVETLTVYNNGLNEMEFTLPEPIEGSIAYGYVENNLITFNTDAPDSTLSSISIGNWPIRVGDFGAEDNQHMYVVDYGMDELLKLDVESGETESMGYSIYFEDLACDKSSGIMYAAVVSDGPISYLFNVNLETGYPNTIGKMESGVVVSIACDGNGNLWGIECYDDYLYSIDPKTGEATPVGYIGFDSDFTQSMAWDPKSDNVYLSAFNKTANESQLRIVNTKTGSTELVGALPDGKTISALAFPTVYPEFLSASPLSGTIAGMSSVDLSLELDATSLSNGDHHSSVTIYSNDADNPSVTVPVNLKVSGQVGEIETSSEFLEFGAVFKNGTKTLPLVITNKGIGDLTLSKITSGLSLFDTDLKAPVTIESEDSTIVNVTFNAQDLGQFYTVLTLALDNSNKDSVNVGVTGSVISSPAIAVSPTEIGLSLNTGETTTKTVTISNSGLYPLQYSLPEIAAAGLLSNSVIEKSDTETTSNNPVLLGMGGSDSSDYVWIDSKEEGGPIYSWVDISETGTEVLEGIDDGSVTVALPFNFKFYNKDKTSVTINSNGYLTFAASGSDFSNEQIPSTNEPNGIIAPYWDDLRPSNKRGQVFYGASAEKFVVQYQNVGNHPYDYLGGSTAFQVILYPSGNIEYVYKAYSLKNSASATIGIENDKGDGGLQIAFNTEYIEPEMSILIKPGGSHFYITASPLSGIVYPNGQKDIELFIDATGLNEGSYFNELTIFSNDPLHPEETITTSLDVIGRTESNVVTDLAIINEENKVLNNHGGLENTTAANNFEVAKNSLMSYPNPAKDITTFVYELAGLGHVKLELYNTTGSYVDLIVDETQSTGKHSTEYSVDNLPSGVYFCRLTIDNKLVKQHILTIK